MKLVLVDALIILHKEVLKTENMILWAVHGRNLITTLDIDLQEYGEKLMSNKKGAIAAIEPSSGEILSLITA